MAKETISHDDDEELKNKSLLDDQSQITSIPVIKNNPVCMSLCVDLSPDLLNLILSKLFGNDRHSFSLVCRQWKTIAQNSLYCYSPCLMNYRLHTRTLEFYQHHSFFFPELENAEIRCSRYGWLLMSRHDDTLFFLDPSNNRKLELPCKDVNQCASLWFFNPPTSPECVVVGVFGINTNAWEYDSGICTLKHGDDEWDCTTYPLFDEDGVDDNDDDSEDNGGHFWFSARSAVLHCGLIFFMNKKGGVAILDIQEKRLDTYPNCLTLESGTVIAKEYLVKVNGEDDLFAVFVFKSTKVNVYRLSSTDMKWDLVESIGDKVLYLSRLSSFGYKARTKSMENTICFPLFRGNAPVFYSLNDAKYRSLDGDYLEINARSSKPSDLAVRRLDKATWIMPMPTAETMISLSWL